MMFAKISCPEIDGRARFWDPHTLVYRFMAEAKRLWEFELHETTMSLTILQATVLLCILYNQFGMDKVGQPYMFEALRIAQCLGIFTDSPDVGEDSRSRDAATFTAWALYAWQAYVFCSEIRLIS